MKKDEIAIFFSSNLAYLELMQDVSDNIINLVGFGEDTRYWISMSVRESVTNAIQHGSNGDQSKRVTVRFQIASDRLVICVQDQGEGFDVSKLPDPLDPKNLLKSSGRGIFYIRSFMEDVRFRLLPEGGLEVKMEKRFSQERKETTMRIEMRTISGVTILDIHGKITLGEGTVEVRDQVLKLLKAGNKKIVFNLGNVSYVDSTGIGELVSSFTTVTNRGGELKLLNLTKKLQELLAITKLSTVFDCYDDEQEAVASFT